MQSAARTGTLAALPDLDASYAPAPIGVVFVHDSEAECRSLAGHLRRAGMSVETRRVASAGALEAALSFAPCDAVIADHKLAQLTSLEALRIARRHDRDLPFLIVADAAGEEQAVEAMRNGADDYLTRGKLGRLEPALLRAVDNARTRRAQRAAERARLESEARFRALSANLPGMVFQLEVRGAAAMLVYASEGSRRLFGRVPQDLVGDARGWFAFFAPDDAATLARLFLGGSGPGEAAAGKARHRRWIEHVATLPAARDGGERTIEFTARARHFGGEHVIWDGIASDITAQRRAEAALRASREELRELAGYLVRVREEERAAVARELHDDIGSTLTGIKFQLAYLRSCAGQDPAVGAQLAHLDQLVEGVILSSTRLMHDLRPGIVDEGIVPALEWQARTFEQRCGVACTFESSHEEVTLPPAASIALFRICQEALNNVAKHASASLAHVRLVAADGALLLEIRDDGNGIPPQGIDRRGHFGVRGMHERAEALGGSVTITGTEEEGTTVRVLVPLPQAAPDAGSSEASA